MMKLLKKATAHAIFDSETARDKELCMTLYEMMKSSIIIDVLRQFLGREPDDEDISAVAISDHKDPLFKHTISVMGTVVGSIRHIVDADQGVFHTRVVFVPVSLN